jgi:hypothetical protein
VELVEQVDSITMESGVEFPVMAKQTRLNFGGETNVIPLFFRIGSSSGVRDDVRALREAYDKKRLEVVEQRKGLVKRAGEMMHLVKKDASGTVELDDKGNAVVDVAAVEAMDLSDLPFDLAKEGLEVKYAEERLSDWFALSYFRAVLDKRKYEGRPEWLEAIESPVSSPFWSEEQDVRFIIEKVNSFRSAYKV